MKTRGEANVYFIATVLFLKTALQLPVYCGIDRRPLSVYTEGTIFLKAAVYQSKLIQQKLIGKGGGGVKHRFYRLVFLFTIHS